MVHGTLNNDINFSDDEYVKSQKDSNIFQRLFLNGTYQVAFLKSLSSVYIVGGMIVLYDVVFIEILRTNYGLDLDSIQVLIVIANLPWNCKIIFGVICDTVRLPISNSFIEAPRRGYLLIFSIIEVICLLTAVFVEFEDHRVLVGLFFIVSLCMAFSDTVIDGICCVQQRRDPERGA